jgi:hypothetical protein
MPRGLPRLWTDDYHRRIYMVPGAMLMLNERNMQYRPIHMDGRSLPADPDPTWNGYSTAEWDGDTLVVHSIGFRDDLWLDSNGNPLTSTGKVTKRISRPNFGTLIIEMTIEDPKAYTKPWTVRITQSAGSRQQTDRLLLPRQREGRVSQGFFMDQETGREVGRPARL